jgi:hypothetical protein
MTIRRWAGALLLLGLPHAPAWAAEEPRTWLELRATDGHWRMSIDSGSLYSNNAGALVSTESELGLPARKTVPGIAFGRLIGQRWRIEIDHSSARRRASTVLASDVKRGEYTFLAGTPLEADVGLSTLRINGGWAAVKTDTTQAVLLLGGQWLRISQRLNGTATPGPPGPRSVDSSDLTPIGLLGVLGQWQPAAQWRLQARAEVGTEKVVQFNAGAQWRPTPHLALGAGYRFMRGEPNSTFCFIGCTRFVSSSACTGRR